MEPEKKGSIFGTAFIVIVLIGLVAYYLSNKNDMREEVDTVQRIENQSAPISETSEEMTQSETELEVEIENLDTDFSDMNAEDLDM